MAITGKNTKEAFAAFVKDESAIELLRRETLANGYTTKARYILSILGQLINNGEEKVFKRLPSEVLGGLSAGQQRNVEATLVARGYETAVRQDPCGIQEQELEAPFIKWDRQEAALQQWAESAGCWYDDITSYAEQKYGYELAHGNEAHVYYYSGFHVAKVITSFFDPQEMLDRISLTNFLLPETGLELLGLGRNKEGQFCFLVLQPFIKGKHLDEGHTVIKEFDAFQCEDPQADNPDYTTPYYRLGDLHDRNVILDITGLPRIIDCNLSLNTPEKGGQWIIPELSFTEENIQEIERQISEFLPKTSKRDFLEKVIDQIVPDFSSQIKKRGYYDGPIDLPMKTGETRRLVFELDKESNTILYTSPETIRAIISKDNRYTKDEKTILTQGKTTIKNLRNIRFSIKNGQIQSSLKPPRINKQLSYKM